MNKLLGKALNNRLVFLLESKHAGRRPIDAHASRLPIMIVLLVVINPHDMPTNCHKANDEIWYGKQVPTTSDLDEGQGARGRRLWWRHEMDDAHLKDFTKRLHLYIGNQLATSLVPLSVTILLRLVLWLCELGLGFQQCLGIKDAQWNIHHIHLYLYITWWSI